MSQRTSPALWLTLLLAAGCGAIRDPSTLRGKKISALSDGDLRGVCAFHLGKYREKLSTSEQGAVQCAGAVMLDIKAYNDLMASSGQRVSRDECASRVADCLAPPADEPPEPVKDCERINPESERRCQATVDELQGCIDERTERTRQIALSLKGADVCDASEPVKALDPLSGPVCSRLRAACPGFRLALPGHVGAVD